MKLSDFITRADQLLALGSKALDTEGRTPYGRHFLQQDAFSQFRGSGLSYLKTVFGDQHPLYADFSRKVKDAVPDDVRQGVGILQAAKDELAGGWLSTVKGLVSAEVFADMLEMATHLLEEHYKDAAAVLTGGVLEEHLRQLCRKNQIPVETTVKGTTKPKKADTLNADLARATVYNTLDQKLVTGWLDLRNKAAHAKYSEYTEQQVALMHSGVADFIARNGL